MISSRMVLFLVLNFAWLGSSADAAVCVWKVTGPKGETLYLGGSIHALKATDYPLPPAYNRAFEAATRLAFESDPGKSHEETRLFLRSCEYPKGDSMRNHVDPRTYDYVRRVFKLMGVPEEKFARFRPWALVLFLQSPALRGLSGELGVEGFFEKRAKANAKPIGGLESAREHIEIFSGLSDLQSEALLLVTFIPNEPGSASFSQNVDAWRRGDAEILVRRTKDGLRDFPAMSERLLGARNRKWIPKIESYLQSGHTYFVVVGAAHMGGSDGVVTLLRKRGYKVEQM